LDECGFVIDFGKLKWLKEWINERFDHTLLLNKNDAVRNYVEEVLHESPMSTGISLAKIVVVPDCSCEGLAAYLMEHVNKVVSENTGGRVSVVRVTVIEDSKNTATLYGSER
jgi:6-pyruvoyltetrahydropterin/6-carboxytetrahydropterin synthase